MAANKHTPSSTKASPDKPSTTPDERTTELAQVADPAKLTASRINEIAGEHGDESDPSQSANADVAETLEQNKAKAKGDDPERPYFAGQGGAFGV